MKRDLNYIPRHRPQINKPEPEPPVQLQEISYEQYLAEQRMKGYDYNKIIVKDLTDRPRLEYGNNQLFICGREGCLPKK